MKILLTNDDGIRAPGIIALYEALIDPEDRLGGPLGVAGDDEPLEVMVVAPATVQSATSHGVTFHEPLMVRETTVTERMEGISVGGRPADCVKLAISELWPERYGKGSKPDLVISGMNAGANCGINVIYSGTVGAALEAAFLGVPSIAVSLLLGAGRSMFDVAAGHARHAIDRILAAGVLDRHGCVSLNLPATEEPEDAPEGAPIDAGSRVRSRARPRPDLVGRFAPPELVVCPMNTHGLVDAYEGRTAPSGERYFWAAGGGIDFHGTNEGSDVDHLFKGRMTLTPLRYDLTDHAALTTWTGALGG
ncbi:MAG: 5'/3'-nucleotidase SurE [Planctomycetota bacterium]